MHIDRCHVWYLGTHVYTDQYKGVHDFIYRETQFIRRRVQCESVPLWFNTVPVIYHDGIR